MADGLQAERGGTPGQRRVRADVDTFVFDLDDTLYPRAAGLHDRMVTRAVQFIASLIGGTDEDAQALHHHYYTLYGTSLVGLQKDYGVAPLDYMRFVHDIDLSPIAPDAELTRAIAALPGRRVIFTNGSSAHAARILGHLGLSHLFDEVCDIEACGFIGKPARAAYDVLLARHRIDPSRSIMFDDRQVNLTIPHDIGMQTVLIGASAPADGDHIHFQTSDLAQFLAQHWR